MLATASTRLNPKEVTMKAQVTQPNLPRTAEFDPGQMLYRGHVQFTLPDGSTHELELLFWGGNTDYYWNANLARDFYAEKIEQLGGTVTQYGVQNATTFSS